MLFKLLRLLFLFAVAPACGFMNRKDSSKNYQTTNTHDESLILANGGVAARDGGIVNITDGGAMQLATDLLTTGMGSAFDFAGRSNANALELSTRSVSGALDFAGRSNANALQFATEALTGTGKTTANALEFVDRGLTGFLSSFTDLLGFASSTQKTAQTATAANTELVSKAYQDATDSSTGNRTLLMVCVAVVGVVGVAMIFRKG